MEPEIDDKVLAHYIREHTSEALKEIEKLDEPELVSLVRSLDSVTASVLVIEMKRYSSIRCLEMIDSDSAAQLLSELSQFDATRLLRSLPDETRVSILDKLNNDHKEEIIRLLSYEEHSIGAHMDPTVLTFTGDQSVEEAISILRKSALTSTNPLYILNRDHQLKGSLNFQSLIMAYPTDVLKSISMDEVNPVVDTSPIISVIDLLKETPADVDLPVTDTGGKFQGVLHAGELTEIGFDTKQNKAAVQAGIAMADLYKIGLAGIVRSIAESNVSNKPNR